MKKKFQIWSAETISFSSLFSLWKMEKNEYLYNRGINKLNQSIVKFEPPKIMITNLWFVYDDTKIQNAGNNDDKRKEGVIYHHCNVFTSLSWVSLVFR